MSPASSPLRRAWFAGLLALAAWLAACGVVGPSKEEVETFTVDVMPAIAEWRPEALAPYSTEGLMKKMKAPDQARMFTVFSKLGGLASFEPPKTVGYFTSTSEGTHVTVEVAARFDNGPAVIRMNLESHGGKLKLHGLNIDSPVFADPSVQPRAPQQI